MWYDLDNAANIFPAVSDERNTNVFRLSCELKDNIDAAILQQALDEAMKSFGYFQVVMRRGLFWFYLERVPTMPIVAPEAERPMKRMFYKSRKELLFAVTYYYRRINLEVFHSVADGGGAIQLLRLIVYKYIAFMYKVKLPPLSGQVSPVAKAEDSFSHHYKPEQKQSPFKQKVYNIGGTSIQDNIRIITGTLSTAAFLAHVKAKGATATGYLAALLICAIYTELMPAKARMQPIAVKIPVDLRKHFRSETARNFFGLVDLVYQFDGGEADFDTVLAAMQAQLKARLNPDELAARMNYNASAQHNIFARAIPLPLKNLALRVAYHNAERTTTCVISNIGRVDMPSEADEYIKDFSFLLSPTPMHRLKAGVCSYGDKFQIAFTSCIEETKAQRYCFRHLVAAGLDITITCNGEL